MPDNKPVYWLSPVGNHDDFGDRITDEIIDAKTNQGPWALMTPKSFQQWNGTNGRLGLGLGQRYIKQPDGKWLKVEDDDPLEGFHPKAVQGLYSYLHFERADGAWYQVSVDRSNPKVTFCLNGQVSFERFANVNELREYLRSKGNA